MTQSLLGGATPAYNETWSPVSLLWRTPIHKKGEPTHYLPYIHHLYIPLIYVKPNIQLVCYNYFQGKSSVDDLTLSEGSQHLRSPELSVPDHGLSPWALCGLASYKSIWFTINKGSPPSRMYRNTFSFSKWKVYTRLLIRGSPCLLLVSKSRQKWICFPISRLF